MKPDGSKYWRLKFRFGGKEKLLALGVYPKLPLAAAHIEAGKARKLLANGIDPTADQASDRGRNQVIHNTFEHVALDDMNVPGWKLHPLGGNLVGHFSA